jgi:hypothetical protein
LRLLLGGIAARVLTVVGKAEPFRKESGKAAFATQEFGAFGTAGRNIIFSDGAENIDLALIKRTHIGNDSRNS